METLLTEHVLWKLPPSLRSSLRSSAVAFDLSCSVLVLRTAVPSASTTAVWWPGLSSPGAVAPASPASVTTGPLVVPIDARDAGGNPIACTTAAAAGHFTAWMEPAGTGWWGAIAGSVDCDGSAPTLPPPPPEPPTPIPPEGNSADASAGAAWWALDSGSFGRVGRGNAGGNASFYAHFWVPNVGVYTLRVLCDAIPLNGSGEAQIAASNGLPASDDRAGEVGLRLSKRGGVHTRCCCFACLPSSFATKWTGAQRQLPGDDALALDIPSSRPLTAPSLSRSLTQVIPPSS